ncbi:MAG: hypothetical protein CL910_17650 [Deltaproteobacteria bacterium]|jgi:peroxiredoxin Q/BCP|nr:hypothetical protein [Deltaproteobacteria bacterium]
MLCRSVASALLVGLLGHAAAAADLAVGSPAPPFRLPGTDGASHALEDYVGKRGVVLAWFPKAFTPG